MKKTLLLGVSLLCSIFIMATEIPFQKAEIKSIMRKLRIGKLPIRIPLLNMTT